VLNILQRTYLIRTLIECTRRLFIAATRHQQRYCDIEIDEKGTLKATEHDKHDTYENIAGSV
jgi:hypothetical protein